MDPAPEPTPADDRPPPQRRWPVAVVGVAALLTLVVVVGVLVTNVVTPHYRPALRDGERYGVDVSNHQGPIDWERVASDDIDFAYIKATEGATFVDQQFARNWEQAAAVGLDRGAYHFFTLCRDGAEQAENFLRTVPSEPGDLPPVIDLELAGNCAARPDQAWIDREVGVFLDAVEEATGQQVVLYLGPEFEERYPVRDRLGRPFWHRRLLLRPDVEGWWMWQLSSWADIAGVDGGVDLNIMRGSHPDDVG